MEKLKNACVTTAKADTHGTVMTEDHILVVDVRTLPLIIVRYPENSRKQFSGFWQTMIMTDRAGVFVGVIKDGMDDQAQAQGRNSSADIPCS